jgi:hypothetical protein
LDKTNASDPTSKVREKKKKKRQRKNKVNENKLLQRNPSASDASALRTPHRLVTLHRLMTPHRL